MSQPTRTRRRPALIVVLLAAALPACLGATCEQRTAVTDFPPGTLRVRFAAAARYTDCLVSSVVMSVRYVLDTQWLSPAQVRSELSAAGLDHTRIADLQAWLKTKNVTMIPLKGELTDAPRIGLGWWLVGRGYPVICVVNKFAGNADYNHAVVVIGMERTGPDPQDRAVYVLDPASPRRLERWDRMTFEHYWGSAGKIMLPLFETPRPPAAQQAKSGASR